MSTGRIVRRNLQIKEIEWTPSSRVLAAGPKVPDLVRVPRRHDPTIALLFGLSVVLLVAGVATMSIGAWLAGGVSLITAFSVNTRPERELRYSRRASAPARRVGGQEIVSSATPLTTVAESIAA